MMKAATSALCLTGFLIWNLAASLVALMAATGTTIAADAPQDPIVIQPDLAFSGLTVDEGPGPEFCSTGPYGFYNMQAGLTNNLPSVRRDMSAFGLFAKKSGCSVKVVCVYSSGDDKAALGEARRSAAAICNTARQMLVRNSFRAPRGNPNVVEANAALRDAIEVEVVSAEPPLSTGSVLVYVEPRA